MSRHLQIVTDGDATISEVSLAEAVSRISGLRIATSPQMALNPLTGEVKSFDEVLTIEYFDDSEQLWEPCFGWADGRVSFDDGSDVRDPESKIGKVARELADALRGWIVDDDGTKIE